jgi:hypothetical protein
MLVLPGALRINRLDVFWLLVQAGPEGMPPGTTATALDLPATKLTFTLKGIQSCVEAMPPPLQLLPAVTTEINIVTIESDRYVSRSASRRMADGEDIFDIPPGELLDPAVIVDHVPATANVIPLRQVSSDHVAEPAAPATKAVDETTSENLEGLISEYTAIVNEVGDEEADDAPEQSPDAA